MNQTRAGAFKEALLNVAVRYPIGLFSQVVLFPLVDIHVPLTTNLELSVYFTVVSIVSSYGIRRWANARLRKQWHKEHGHDL